MISARRSPSGPISPTAQTFVGLKATTSNRIPGLLPHGSGNFTRAHLDPSQWPTSRPLPTTQASFAPDASTPYNVPLASAGLETTEKPLGVTAPADEVTAPAINKTPTNTFRPRQNTKSASH